MEEESEKKIREVLTLGLPPNSCNCRAPLLCLAGGRSARKGVSTISSDHTVKHELRTDTRVVTNEWSVPVSGNT